MVERRDRDDGRAGSEFSNRCHDRVFWRNVGNFLDAAVDVKQGGDDPRVA
jgi:hypothetical protein